MKKPIGSVCFWLNNNNNSKYSWFYAIKEYCIFQFWNFAKKFDFAQFNILIIRKFSINSCKSYRRWALRWERVSNFNELLWKVTLALVCARSVYNCVHRRNMNVDSLWILCTLYSPVAFVLYTLSIYVCIYSNIAIDVASS